MTERNIPRLTEVKWSRRCSVNLYRNLKLPLWQTSFFKDWINDANGDPYPLMGSGGEASESVGEGRYTVRTGVGETVCRLLGSHFPFATYELEFSRLEGCSVGIRLSGGAPCEIEFGGDRVRVFTEEGEQSFLTERCEAGTLAVSFRTDGVSVYLNRDGFDKRVCDVDAPSLSEYRKESVLHGAKTLLTVRGEDGGVCVLRRIESFISSGISQADLRPVKYEDGEVMVESGRVLFTATARCEKLSYQIVLSLNPTLCDFRLEGAMFYSYGDGVIHGDVAPSLIYDRCAGIWRIRVWSRAHGHILAYADSFADPRYGINIIDAELMDKAQEGAERTEFLAFEGDEDPEMILADGVWHLAICRLDENRKYHYFHYTSDRPDGGFRFADMIPGLEKTGGSFVKAPEGVYFVCGSDFDKRSVYDIYPLNDFSAAPKAPQTDYPDGGFRGWGSMFLYSTGSRKRYLWVTFDRHGGSSFRWSYGNIYIFESESF